MVGDNSLEPESGLTVADVAEQQWQVRPEPVTARFGTPGWSYERQVDVVCPRCHGALHALRKPYESAGKAYKYVAVVCPGCPATFTLAYLSLKQHADLLAKPGTAQQVSRSDRRQGSTVGRRHERGGDRPGEVGRPTGPSGSPVCVALLAILACNRPVLPGLPRGVAWAGAGLPPAGSPPGFRRQSCVLPVLPLSRRVS